MPACHPRGICPPGLETAWLAHVDEIWLEPQLSEGFVEQETWLASICSVSVHVTHSFFKS